MKLDHNPFGVLREKSRSLRGKSDRTRIQASSAVTCEGSLTSPKVAHFQPSHEGLAHQHPSLKSSVDSLAHHHHHHGHHRVHHHNEISTNSPILLGDDKELHDPNFVRHNWEMMSGEATYPDNQLHIGRAASPHLTSRRSTLSSRTASSRPSSRSGSEAGGHHTPTFGLGVNAFSGLSSYSQTGSVGRAKGGRSSSTRGLLVEGSILRDEEAVLDSDDDSNDDDNDNDEEYGHDLYSTYHLTTSRPNSRPTSRRPSPSQTSLQHPSSIMGMSNPPSPILSHDHEPQQAASSAAYQRRRHWTVAEGSQASNGAGVHATLPNQVPRGTIKERSLSQPA
ncbi:uncharacterized protein MEPE_00244 [Melanopsichium pennsylvanicum]|uniref:Uncharacterized protein n=2 Tax=Melanopsichium pennsylvanicum TaxID=63383 RepID=A0AAJ5C2L2_9BASI|nr:hypothetical protein BN887_02030 [Melanopsichium pennsylvanicum 4]SNX81539.1 uncharacterized protein MEPE_00244 [Melanopsichium pennsylvanicum]